jgi:cytoskeleton protein RodZ
MTGLAEPTGPRLKAERERRGLSSQKAADELHLDGWVIDALEAENYERIGPSVYAKGHLKRYAALLGLPPAEIMAAYESRAQAPKSPAAPPANVRLRTDVPAVSSPPWPQLVGSVAAAALIFGVLWWKPWHHRGAEPAAPEPTAANSSAASPESAADSAAAGVGSSAASTTMPMPQTPSTTPTSMPSPPLVAPGSSSTLSSAAAMPATHAIPPEPDAAAGTGHARLRLSFSADSWVDVHDAAGRRVFAGNGLANSVRTIAGVAPMRVYLGFASGVQLEINNRAVAIGPQFVAGDVARFEAGADGVLRRDSHNAAMPGVATPGTATPGVATPDAQARNARPTG